MEPRPTRFFWPDAKGSLEDDIALELKNRISGRRWNEVTLMDWRMIGLPPAASRLYLEPAAFVYYLPSIILGVLYPEIDFVEYALEAIIPYNQSHVPRGRWWFDFVSLVSPNQRRTLAAFLEYIRLTAWDSIGEANQHFLEVAEGFWLHP
jgi:hypothetical protein